MSGWRATVMALSAMVTVACATMVIVKTMVLVVDAMISASMVMASGRARSEIDSGGCGLSGARNDSDVGDHDLSSAYDEPDSSREDYKSLRRG